MSGNDRQILARNIAARKAAEAMLEEGVAYYLSEYDVPRSGRRRFWQTILEEAQDRLGLSDDPAPHPNAMTDAQAVAYEQEVVDVPGMYKGKRTNGELPIDYVLLICDGNDATRRMKRYAASRRFQERQG